MPKPEGLPEGLPESLPEGLPDRVELARKMSFQFVIGMVCVILAYVRLKEGWDPLSDLYLGSTGYLWSHFVMYCMMGYIDFWGDEHPYVYAFGVSAVWELIELLIGVGTGTIQYWTSGGPQGQMKDVTVNAIGFFIGRQVQRVMPCRLKDCPNRLVNTYEAMAVITTVVAVVRLALQKV